MDQARRRVVYRGRKIDLALQEVALSDGSTAEREVVVHRGAVALLVLVDDQRLCLVRNERYAVGATLLEVPAGTLDPGETPEATAVRELAEETGYTAGRITRIASWYVSPGVLDERMSLFVCADLRPGEPAHQPDEWLEPVILGWDEALAMVADGRIEDAKTMLALMIGQRWREASAS
jgi:ADP-ribose pyrophosphatase